LSRAVVTSDEHGKYGAKVRAGEEGFVPFLRYGENGTFNKIDTILAHEKILTILTTRP
jgi:hypothetical protein